MGFELDACLGKVSALRKWKLELSSAVVRELGGELGLVPLTGRLRAELHARLGKHEEHLDRTQAPRTHTRASDVEALRRWVAQASVESPVVCVSTGEFGNQSHDEASVWWGGREVLSAVNAQAALDYLRDRAGVDFGDRPIDLERYRGEDAAEKWAAADP